MGFNSAFKGLNSSGCLSLNIGITVTLLAMQLGKPTKCISNISGTEVQLMGFAVSFSHRS